MRNEFRASRKIRCKEDGEDEEVKLWVKRDQSNMSPKSLIYLRERGIIGNILKPILDFYGFITGHWWCARCKDSWYWKSSNGVSKKIRMFPVCDECWGKISREEKHYYVNWLADEWRSKHPLEPKVIQEISNAHHIIDGEPYG